MPGRPLNINPYYPRCLSFVIALLSPISNLVWGLSKAYIDA